LLLSRTLGKEHNGSSDYSASVESTEVEI